MMFAIELTNQELTFYRLKEEAINKIDSDLSMIKKIECDIDFNDIERITTKARFTLFHELKRLNK